MGLPCNELQRLLVEEKTFEAPLSLFIQSPGAKKYSLVFQGCFLSSEDSATYTRKNCLLWWGFWKVYKATNRTFLTLFHLNFF